MKIIPLILIMSFSCFAQSIDDNSQGVLISQNSADYLLSHKLSKEESERFHQLKKELFDVIKIANKLNEKNRQELLDSQYVKNIRTEIKEISKKLKKI